MNTFFIIYQLVLLVFVILNFIFFILVNQEIIKVVQPIFLGKVIRYFEIYNPEDMNALYESLGYAAGLSLCTVGLVVLHHLYFYYVQRSGMKIRVAMCHMIYKKVSRNTGKPGDRF